MLWGKKHIDQGVELQIVVLNRALREGRKVRLEPRLEGNEGVVPTDVWGEGYACQRDRLEQRLQCGNMPYLSKQQHRDWGFERMK